MQKIVGLKEFRSNVDTLIKHINNGHKFIVFKRGKPVFEISPVGPNVWEEVIDFTKIKKGGVNIKQLLSRL
ncbi:MAG: hypothetical protein A3H72_00355 [Candidatus Doudnabacteria bacterium RIFCSPLOWO2_02_FULL_48_8]|uniref:Antitoxin n=1 Tax=Candidatus Doudnabacteria bacterium RIFCSPHIGHO2_01_FULL_46_24 TaxID=1817825 RepID=A0A1F5NWH9_9BACT|nr:MAG: hypothetical protein A2720_03560 [Candidatus Doudnabacteria bacterium RIFCSPHIGHO2_01_FULL_46_24]OGE95317.1 MAG: hypothetical protein A3H72_00355 [Candidatus Doudnabacteria bacterium RIFCSPLOWO2_02_FULL_48_8]OGE95622.1 MAG: hypothetical protein A3E98_01325 [Candidatus Doudnabacteria bacterium RIFCSPHIGHO2_12_FULL_48_11]